MSAQGVEARQTAEQATSRLLLLLGGSTFLGDFGELNFLRTSTAVSRYQAATVPPVQATTMEYK